MQKYTVWMSGDNGFDSLNRRPLAFSDIEAEDFISACKIVWEHHHGGKNGHWVLDINGKHPIIHHDRREWSYGLYMTYEDALDSTIEANRKFDEEAGVYNDI